MNEFKELLYDLLIDDVNQEIWFDKLTSIYNWPEISYYDEEEDSRDYEPLGVENCSIIDITDDYLEITCGGDTQEPHMVRVTLLDGELSITSCEPHEFLEGIDYEEFLDELTS